ncbi:MoaD/ThiS family protein [Gaetbulibacter sp. M240]|uniref:MoaD/ThiS family protein n=1 Tax=Gaetbulibacter sp. M240 TaxID=3126511 RepID=UPI00374ED193
MLVTIKYFGQIIEITKCDEEKLEFHGSYIQNLVEKLYEKYPKLTEIEFKVAQNQELVSTETFLSSAEIALLPPFAGG